RSTPFVAAVDGGTLTEESLHGEVARAELRTDLPPRALLGLLVLPEAQQPRPVAEAVALHLVVADLDDELGPHRRLLELAGAPAVRLAEAPLGRVLEQRLHESRDLGLDLRGDGRRADAVELALLVVQAEEERRDL